MGSRRRRKHGEATDTHPGTEDNTHVPSGPTAPKPPSSPPANKLPSSPPAKKQPSKSGRSKQPFSGKSFLLGVIFGLLLGVGAMALRDYEVRPGDVLGDVLEMWRTLDPAGQFHNISAIQLPKFKELVPAMPSFASNYSLFQEVIKPGRTILEMGYNAKHPVVMVPGFVTTGLELWSGDECAMKYFRQRMWGTFAMVQSMLLDPTCWMDHMALDPVTGLDPEGRKLRPAQGFEAADYFVPGYWVWSKIIENLALLGYDNNNMVLMSYDWRLSPQMLEQRDHYFTRLQRAIELQVAQSQTKAVIMAHSMGVNVVLYFLKWVESPQGGRGGPDWVARHLHSFVNLAGPILGVSKAVSALLSGEMRDTTTLGPLEPYLTWDVFRPQRRRDLFRSWYSLLWLIPKGGDAIWGSLDSAPDDASPPNPSIGAASRHTAVSSSPPQQSFGTAIRFADGGAPNLTMAGALELLKVDSPPHFRANMEQWFSFGVAENPAAPEYDAPKYWTNALEMQLPKAPDFTIHCLYGVGLDTERAYHYAASTNKSSDVPTFLIDKTLTDETIANGVALGPGDGTVPLLSLGYMCAKGWKDARYNPHGVKVKIREYSHQKIGFIPHPRGGTTSGDHIDIMGNSEYITDVLNVAAGYGDELDDRIVSDIRAMADKVVLPSDQH